jgi:hypothetical protein
MVSEMSLKENNIVRTQKKYGNGWKDHPSTSITVLVPWYIPQKT